MKADSDHYSVLSRTRFLLVLLSMCAHSCSKFEFSQQETEESESPIF